MAVIFLTGVTGVLGCEILKEVSKTNNHKLFLLVRGTSYFHAASRIEDLAIKLGIVEADLKEKIEILNGDLELPNFGLDQVSYNRLKNEVEFIIHSAAELSLKSSVDEARSKIVIPMHNLLNFVHGSNKIKKFIDISTVGVGGLDYPSVPEERLHTKYFRNGYEQAKFDSESIIFDSIKPLTEINIIRPSMIIGRQTDGWSLKPQIFSSICRLVSGQLTSGVVPDIRGFHLDTITTDIIAKTALLLCEYNQEQKLPEIINLASGKELRVSFSALIEKIISVLEINEIPKIIDLSEFEVLLPLIQKTYSEIERRKLSFIPFFLSYFNSDQIFENASAISVLNQLGLELPQPSSYLDKTIKHVFKNDALVLKRQLRRVVRS